MSLGERKIGGEGLKQPVLGGDPLAPAPWGAAAWPWAPFGAGGAPIPLPLPQGVEFKASACFWGRRDAIAITVGVQHLGGPQPGLNQAPSHETAGGRGGGLSTVLTVPLGSRFNPMGTGKGGLGYWGPPPPPPRAVPLPSRTVLRPNRTCLPRGRLRSEEEEEEEEGEALQDGGHRAHPDPQGRAGQAGGGCSYLIPGVHGDPPPNL